ncbi:FtsW/RodA/SpoVE family cell cycle protein [bacterium]|nr:MAG: FtsW/RodA/SpoVE family cell cycle protein [bacterium]
MIKNIFSKIDIRLSIPIVVLVIISITMNYSLTFGVENPALGGNTLIKHTVFLIVGFTTYVLVSQININFIFEKQVIFLLALVNILLMIGVLFTPEIANVHRWFVLGPVQVQVSELTKLINLVLITFLLSHFFEIDLFTKVKKRQDAWLYGLLILGLILVTFFLISLEPSLGSAVLITIIQVLVLIYFWPYKKPLVLALFVVSSFSLLLFFFPFELGSKFFFSIAGLLSFSILLSKLLDTSKLVLVISVCLGLSLLPLTEYAYKQVLNDYQRARVESFLSQEARSQDQSYQQDNAKIAIQNGAFFGAGYLQGIQSKGPIPNLPYSFNDFFFAGFAEEFGVLGTLGLLTLFSLILLRILDLANTMENPTNKILLTSFAITIAVQTTLHIFINMGFVVNTGIPMPILSYGGTSNLIFFVMFGMVNSMNNATKDSSFLKYNK